MKSVKIFWTINAEITEETKLSAHTNHAILYSQIWIAELRCQILPLSERFFTKSESHNASGMGRAY